MINTNPVFDYNNDPEWELFLERYAMVVDVINTRLSKRQRKLLKLRLEDKLTFKEIADQMGVTTQAVSASYNNCIVKIRKIITKM